MEVRHASLPPLDRLRLERDVKHALALGGSHPERIFTEILLGVGGRIGGLPAISAVLAEYRRLTPGQVRAAGGDRPSRRPLAEVPRGAAR